MYPVIAHIYGPFAINSYGFFIALALTLFTWRAINDPQRSAIISVDNFFNALFIAIIAGVVGSRILFILSNPEQMSFGDMLKIWEGGLSFLGAVIAVLIVIPIYLKTINTPLLPFLDLVGLYAPLAYGCARIGCFFAGCCYGLPTNAPWAVIFTHPESRAPLCVALHPTQLYSVISAMIIFGLLHLSRATWAKKQGQIISSYLALAGLERFIVDFWRNDRLFIATSNRLISAFSVDQWVALATLAVGIIALVIATSKKN